MLAGQWAQAAYKLLQPGECQPDLRQDSITSVTCILLLSALP